MHVARCSLTPDCWPSCRFGGIRVWHWDLQSSRTVAAPRGKDAPKCSGRIICWLLERNHRPPHLRCLLCIRQCSAHRQPDPGNRSTCSDPAAALVVAVSGNLINRVRSQPIYYASCWSQVSCQPPHSQRWPRQLQWSRIPSSTAWSQQRVAGLWGPARSPHTARRAGRNVGSGLIGTLLPCDWPASWACRQSSGWGVAVQYW